MENCIIKRIIISAANGIQLFGMNLETDDEYVVNKSEDIMKANGLVGMITFCNAVLLNGVSQDKFTENVLINDLLWTIHNQEITHYFPKQITIKYKVIVVAKVDLLIPIDRWRYVLLDLCRRIAFHFYEDYKNIIEGFTNVDLTIFAGFKNKCEKQVDHFYESLGEGVEKSISIKSSSLKKSSP